MRGRNRPLLLCAAILAIFSLVGGIASTAQATAGATPAVTTLNSAERLRKMSLRIRGIAPSEMDFQKLAQANAAGQTERFFEATANDYAVSRWADHKLAENMSDDFRFTFDPSRDDDEPAADQATQYGEYQKNIRAALQDGHNWPQIMTGSKIHELAKVSALNSELADLQIGLLRRPFVRKARDLGFDLNSVDGAETALRAYRSNRKTFEGTLPMPANRAAAFRVLGEAILGAVPTRHGSAIKPQAAATALKTAAANYNGQNRNDLAPQERQLLTEMLRYPTVTGENRASLDLVIAIGAFYERWRVRDDDVKRTACALVALENADFPADSSVVNLCGILNPYPKPAFEKDDALTARIYAGFFRTADGYKYSQANYESITSMFPELASRQAPSRPEVPNIARSREFRDRYRQTPYSHAAAFFRIFLCDEMQLVAIVDKSKKTQNSLSSFFATGAANQTPTLAPTTEDRRQHAKGDCIACHRKLEPAKSLLEGNAFAPSKAFEFVYDDFDGQEHRISVPDENSMLPLLTEQPQFARCQVRKMWNWVIGEDVFLDSKREADLLRVYKETDANPKKMLAYLSLRPEFSTDSTFAETPNFSSVRPFLQRCNGCHASEGTVPSFTSLPFGFGGPDESKIKKDHVAYVTNIAKQIDLVHEGANAKMPPPKAGWSPSASERDALSRWIMGGARDEMNRPTLTQAESDEILRGTSVAKQKRLAEPRQPIATFRPTWKRFFQGYDLVKFWLQKTKVYWADVNNRSNRLAIGLKDVTTGKPVTDQPSNSFREYYSQSLNGNFRELRIRALRGDQQAIRAVGLSHLKLAVLNPSASSWQDLPDEARLKTYDSLIEWYIGPGVLEGERLSRLKAKIAKSTDVVLGKNPAAAAIDVALNALNVIANDDELLTH